MAFETEDRYVTAREIHSQISDDDIA